MNNWLKNNQRLNFNTLLEKVFKQNCMLCAGEIDSKLALCLDCLKELPAAPDPSCPQCALQSKGETCGNCHNNQPYYDYTYALFAYAFPVDAMIQYYKYNNALYLSHTLASLLQKKILGIDIDAIIPMPLHVNRLKERGFNQSLEVAKVVARQRNFTLDSTNCIRIKNTRSQAGLAPKERLKNMKGAFACQTNFTGMHIALIDDVMTTGASLNELAKTLKQAGATKVSCYVMARAT